MRMMKGRIENKCIAGLPIDEMLIEGDQYAASITLNLGEISLMPWKRWTEHVEKLSGLPMQDQEVKDYLLELFSTAKECNIEESSPTDLGELASRLGEDGDEVEILYEEGLVLIRNMKNFKENNYLKRWSFVLNE